MGLIMNNCFFFRIGLIFFLSKKKRKNRMYHVSGEKEEAFDFLFLGIKLRVSMKLKRTKEFSFLRPRSKQSQPPASAQNQSFWAWLQLRGMLFMITIYRRFFSLPLSLPTSKRRRYHPATLV
jgi:hypothetical protein